MLSNPGLEPIDYLLIGHISQDLTPTGTRIGGTVSYASLTAKALGGRVGIVTSWGEETGKELLEDISIVNQASDHSTTFENIYTPEGRLQTLHHLAEPLDFYHIPELWRKAPVVHLAPLAGEINSNIVRFFPEAQIYLTPQGWLRQWDDQGRVRWREWPEARHILQQVSAVVISEEDVLYDPAVIDMMAQAAPILVVTQGADGATLYTQGNETNFPAPEVALVEETGAGDIFAAAFFVRLSTERDPFEAVRFANLVAADSVTREGLSSAPTEETLYNLIREVQ